MAVTLGHICDVAQHRRPRIVEKVFWRCRTFLATLAIGSIAISSSWATDDVLLLGPTVIGGTASPEYKIITSTGPVPGYPSVIGLGLTAHIATTAADWATQLAASPPYKAIVLGNPSCSTSPATPLAWTTTTTAALKAATPGNAVIIGTDPTVHSGAGGVWGIQLLRSSINFAVGGFASSRTGAVVALSCYYQSSPAGTPVPVLDAFASTANAFKVQGNIPCAGDVAIVATSPALTGLTGGAGGTLSSWNCSVHEGFNSWDPSFIPLAIATDVAAALKTYPTADPKGFPYILARGKDLTVAADTGILKICKVAGVGITVGTPFTFTAGSSTIVVPAGPAPGGTCMVGPSFAVGTNVTVAEAVPAGVTVSSIVVAPPAQLIGTPNLAAGSVNISIGPGVTEVTFTDTRIGYLEICKKGNVVGNFVFTVNPGSLGPFTVPAGACSPAIAVPAGSVTIHEQANSAGAMNGCNTIPPAQQGACNTTLQNSTVTVAPGNISTMTIAFITNKKLSLTAVPDGAGPAQHAHGLAATYTMIECAAKGPTVVCNANVKATSPQTTKLSGVVNFIEGNNVLATVVLSADASVTFSTSELGSGDHAIVALYGGDNEYAASTSQQSTVTIVPP